MNANATHLILLHLLLSVYSSGYGQLSLIKPLYPDAPTRDSNPRRFTVWGDKVCFAADDIRGSGLWITDGTEAGTIKAFSGLPIREIIAADSLVYFVTEDGGQLDIWATDGREGNYRHLFKHDTFGGDIYLRDLKAFRNKLYFFLWYRADWWTIYQSDGTKTGTFPLDSLNKEIGYSGDFNFIDNKLHFWDPGPGASWGLWQSDGTVTGTFEQFQYPFRDKPIGLLKHKNDYYFFASKDSVWGLWKFNPDSSLLGFVVSLPNGRRPIMHSHKNSLYLITSPPAPNRGVRALWRTNGEKWNLELIKELPVSVKRVFSAGNQMYLINDYYVWISNGTTTGSQPFLSFKDLPKPGRLQDLTFVDNNIYFLSNDTLWIRATQNKFPQFITSVNKNGNISGLVYTNGQLFFSKTNPYYKSGKEPHYYDIAEGETHMVSDIYSMPVEFGVEQFSAFEDKLFFTVEDHRGKELWQTNGTDTATHIVADIYPGEEGSQPHGVLQFENNYYFTAADSQNHYQLWELNGENGQLRNAAEHLQIQTDPALKHPHKVLYHGKMYFPARKKGTDDEPILFAYDSQHKSTAVSNLFTYPEFFVPTSSGLFFQAEYEGNKRICLTDGTNAGTSRVSNSDLLIKSHASKSVPVGTDGVNMYFSSRNPELGTELFMSNGTEQGTRMLRDIYEGQYSSSPLDMIFVNDKLYFSANVGSIFRELWVSDGTYDGTRLVKDFWDRGSGISEWYWEKTGFKGELFFTAKMPEYGTELWKTDGTKAGTHLIGDFVPGPESSNPHSFVVIDTFLYFVAADSLGKDRIWRTDGTSSGTEQLEIPSDFSYPIQPDNLTAFKQDLYFSGTDTVLGKSLFVYKLTKDAGIFFSETANRLHLWPNPAEATLYLTLRDDLEGLIPFEVIDTQGKRVITGKWDKKPDNQVLEIALGELSKGFYIFILKKDDQIFHRKFFVR